MRPCVLAVGNFDGVHQGHAALLTFAREKAHTHGLPLVVLTFDPLPGEYFAARASIGSESKQLNQELHRICTTDQRVRLITSLGADVVEIEPFNVELQQLAPQDFVTDTLHTREQARVVVVGEDFRFGHKRAGDIALLQKLCIKEQIECHALSLVRETGEQPDGVKYSSSCIRAALRNGDLALVNNQLGYSWQMTGLVQSGDGRGSGLGFATANLTPDLPLPGLRGVFVSSLYMNGKWLDAVTNIGSRPTFGDGRVHCETHLLNPPGVSLYNQRVTLALHQKLRDEVRFAEPEALIAQITSDVEQARVWHAANSPVFTPHLEVQVVTQESEIAKI